MPTGRILVAVSGGADSIVLLRLLAQSRVGRTVPVSLTTAATPTLAVGHFNHRIRGAESDTDEAFVREQAAALGLPFVCASADIPAIAASTGESLEMAARRLRHDFLQNAARENSCVAIATGHTADDQLETFFLRLARGSSLRGLCGGGSAATSPVQDRIPLIKPLLRYRHRELVAWLESHGFPWREDSSNTSPDYQRNRVRQTLIPAFEKTLGASAFASALRTIELLREDNDYLETLARNIGGFGETALPSCRELAALPLPLFNRVAADYFYTLPIEPELITSKTLARFRGMVSTPPRGTKRMPVACGWYVERVGDEITLVEKNDVDPAPKTLNLHITTDVLFVPPPRSRTLELPLCFYVSSEIDATKIALRAPKPGDRISPAGSGITRKISDILTDLKIPRARRRGIVVAVDTDDKIIALPGYATDERAKVLPGENAVRIDVRAD